jgi:hypothetical protein
MSLRIRLEGERGQQYASIADTKYLFWHLMQESDVKHTCCLRFIDPYGNTVFNRLQMPQLLMELESLHEFIKSSEQAELLSKIEEFAHRCAHEPHNYIKIYGD